MNAAHLKLLHLICLTHAPAWLRRAAASKSGAGGAKAGGRARGGAPAAAVAAADAGGGADDFLPRADISDKVAPLMGLMGR
jgi:hypothetical protein